PRYRDVLAARIIGDETELGGEEDVHPTQTRAATSVPAKVKRFPGRRSEAIGH
ncbi:hypothetical protein LTR93_011142, partial [Exophiala xenobiotica]